MRGGADDGGFAARSTGGCDPRFDAGTSTARSTPEDDVEGLAVGGVGADLPEVPGEGTAGGGELVADASFTLSGSDRLTEATNQPMPPAAASVNTTAAAIRPNLVDRVLT